MKKADFNKIDEFWKWFVGQSLNFMKNYENQAFLSELDKRIKMLGNIVLEIGPGFIDQNKLALTISPSGNKDLLPYTKMIVDFAPAIEGWEFYSSKPPKNWNRKFTLENENEQDIPIDANNWRYVLFRYPDGKYEINVEAPEILTLGDDFSHMGVEIVIDAVIGEELRMVWIDDIEVVEEIGMEYREKSNSIKELSPHIKQLTELSD